MGPDRRTDFTQLEPALADEIDKANVIRLERRNGRWIARIGPNDLSGHAVSAASPISAIRRLAVDLANIDWPFDDTWRERT